MKVVCVSDTHNIYANKRWTVPDGDVLIHAGDLTMMGSEYELQKAFEWIESLPHKHKVVIAGNHDWLFEKDPDAARKLVPPGVHYLQDSGAAIGGLIFWGSPVQPAFGNWAFNRGREITEHWKQIPDIVDVLITHGPPAGVLDSTFFGHSVGCHYLQERIQQVQPRLHVFGHIHESYGQLRRGKTLHVNASLADGMYDPCNDPIEVDLYD